MTVTLVARTKEGRLIRHVMEHEANVGRAASNDLVLPGPSLDDHHARFVHRDGRTVAVDLRSRSGTFVNGRRIDQPTILRDGDGITIGEWRVTVERAEHAAETVRAIEAARPFLPEDELPPDTDRGDGIPTPLVPPPLPDEPLG